MALQYLLKTVISFKKSKRNWRKKFPKQKVCLQRLKKNATNSLSELKLLDNQIKSREALVRVFDNKVRVAVKKVIENEK